MGLEEKNNATDSEQALSSIKPKKQIRPVPVIGIVLGGLSVIAALSIYYVTYSHSVNSTEQRNRQFYLQIARTIAAEADANAELSDQVLLALISERWGHIQEKPDDQYLCIVDRDSKLILHTLAPRTIGNNVGRNRIIGNRDCEPCTLSEIVDSQTDYVGGFLSSAGQEQIVAFVTLPQRGWTLGVHRSRQALRREIRLGLQPLFVGLIVVCGVLMPASLSLLSWTFCAAQRKQKKAERQREQLLEMLGDKNNELQSIVYVASHDLKTPLVNISGFSGMLKEHCNDLREILQSLQMDMQTREQIQTLLDEDIKEDLSFIHAGVEQVHSLLDGLLRISRVSTAQIAPQRIDMNQVLAELVNMMRFQSEEKQAVITVDSLPDCICDAGQVKQVFTNLIDNALKYLHPDRKGKIHISGRVQDERAVYCVEDNGIGIEEKFCQKIFEIYYRLDASGPVDGDGLGLSIVRRILERHNGQIRVESKPDMGSKFYVSLPCQEASE